MSADHTWPHGPQPAGRMTLQDKGCPGLFLPIRGHTAPLCLGCDRYGKQTPEVLDPAARFDISEWQCIERRALGSPVAPVPAPGSDRFHAASVPPEPGDGQSANRGGALAYSTRSKDSRECGQ